MMYDICIIGGGINGVGVARDAAGRGLKVLLLEKGDLGECTSSKSSKMIHGGLRYLEFFEFGLVRKSLAEREVMMRIAPQIVSPLRLCIPHRNTVRPAWMVRIGLFLYDHLSRLNLLPKSERIDLARHAYGQALAEKNGTGFVYSDCRVDDARLVILSAMDAAGHGADIRTRCEVTNLIPQNNSWKIETPQGNFSAKMIVNAAGPYVRVLLDKSRLSLPDTPKLRLVQGSHIIVPKLYDGDHSYLIQCPDKRVVFVWPYLDKFSLVGTTETDFQGDPMDAAITDDEIDYLCAVVNSEFKKKVSKQDIVLSYCGVRPLFDVGAEADNRKVTRDYKLIVDDHHGSKILNIFGGKLTTYRPLAEEVVNMLNPYFPQMTGAWTGKALLPLVDFEFRPDEKTLRHFVKNEFARTMDDILWRRTKWGLTLSRDKLEKLEEIFESIKNDKNSVD